MRLAIKHLLFQASTSAHMLQKNNLVFNIYLIDVFQINILFFTHLASYRLRCCRGHGQYYEIGRKSMWRERAFYFLALE